MYIRLAAGIGLGITMALASWMGYGEIKRRNKRSASVAPVQETQEHSHNVEPTETRQFRETDSIMDRLASNYQGRSIDNDRFTVNRADLSTTKTLEPSKLDPAVALEYLHSLPDKEFVEYFKLFISSNGVEALNRNKQLFAQMPPRTKLFAYAADDKARAHMADLVEFLLSTLAFVNRCNERNGLVTVAHLNEIYSIVSKVDKAMKRYRLKDYEFFETDVRFFTLYEACKALILRNESYLGAA